MTTDNAKPTVTNVRMEILERNDNLVLVLLKRDGYEDRVAYITVPRWWHFWGRYKTTLIDTAAGLFINCGRFDTAQAALDALVAAYEQTLATDTAGASGNEEAGE